MGEFTTLANMGKHVVVQREGSDVVAGALLDGEGCVRAGVVGRGELLRFPFKSGWGVVRPCRRGGVIGWLLTDSYLFSNRPLREFRVHVAVFEKGLPVPEPLGVCWERRGPCFSGAIATREVNAADLLEYLSAAPCGTEELLGRVGGLIRQTHDAGVLHADLQVRNILVGPDGLYLVDLDKAKVVSRPGRLRCARNLLRLRRSCDKNGLSPSCFEAVCRGYGIDRLPGWLSRLYRIKGRLSDALSGRGVSHGTHSG